MHQLLHQRREMPIRLHQLRLRTDKPIRHRPHAPEKRILEDPVRLVHPVGQLGRKLHHIVVVPRYGRDFRDHDRLLRMFLVH